MKKYYFLFIYTLPVLVYLSLTSTGWITLLPVFIYFGLVPLIDFFIKPDHSNLSREIEKKLKEDPFFDWLIFLIIPIHIALLIQFLFVIEVTSIGTLEYYGRMVSIGIMLGVSGINLGHELGHRNNRLLQYLGELLLLTSLNTHFLPYHNAGHHLNVATPKDSATARKNEILFIFWFRSHFGSYKEAWLLENNRMRIENKSIFSFQNRMVFYSILNIILLLSIFLIFGLKVFISFLIVASIGILLLETVNYIEHYGLLRKQNENGRYEKVKHFHSWNSDHIIGRCMLFNLSRHSDHHYNGSKKYQLLKSVESSPQMPTGYPGMMLLSFIQPLWFYIMNKKLKEIKNY
jgi:alkane 1-monooxygenase